jgi:hypothetical protein
VFAWEPIQDFLLPEIINVGAGQVTTVGCFGNKCTIYLNRVNFCGGMMKPTMKTNKQTNKICSANLDLIGASFFSTLHVWLLI